MTYFIAVTFEHVFMRYGNILKRGDRIGAPVNEMGEWEKCVCECELEINYHMWCAIYTLLGTHTHREKQDE